MNLSESGLSTTSPFGGRPFESAGRFGNRYADPLSQGFGFFGGNAGGRAAARRWENNLAGASGPTADFIRQGNAFLPTMLGSAQDVGNRISAQGQQGFDALQGATADFMRQLPNLQAKVASASGPNAGLPYANQLAAQAFNPIASQALYQNALRGSLDASRAGAAARGTVSDGGAQAVEERMARDLAGQFAQNQFANQQSATATLGSLSAQDAATRQQGAGLEASLAAMGPQAQQMLFSAIPQLGQLLQAQYQLPMDALTQFSGFLAAQQNPQLALLQATAPTVGSESKGFGIL